MALQHGLCAALALAVLVHCTEQAPVTQCPNHPTSACSHPQWGVKWGMKDSTYGYCFNSCPLASLASQKALGLFGGVVGVDHYWTKQGMPCVDGLPHEFASQENFTLETKRVFPGARVLQYRITDAVTYDPLVYNKMQTDPGFFVRYHHAPYNNGSICVTGPKAKTGTGPEYGNCKYEVVSAAYDYSKAEVREWYLDQIIKPAMKTADGVWLDGDGPDNGAYECSGNYDWDKLKPPYPANNASEVDVFCKGEAAVVSAAQAWLIANKGFEYGCFKFVDNGLPAPGDPTATCVSKVQGLASSHTLASAAAVGLYGGRTGAKWPSGGAYNESSAQQAVAVFLLTRREHWYFVLPESNEVPASVAGLLLSDYGAPLGNLTQTGSVFSRRFEGKTVSLDCSTFTAAFEPHSLTGG